MCLEGWSNVHNKPILAVCVTTTEGKTYPMKTIDTAEYLQELAKGAIVECHKCRVRSFVMDNAANVIKMQLLLEAEDELQSGADPGPYLGGGGANFKRAKT